MYKTILKQNESEALRLTHLIMALALMEDNLEVIVDGLGEDVDIVEIGFTEKHFVIEVRKQQC